MLKEPQIHHDEDALEWWKTTEKRFPIVGKLARRYLAVLLTSVPSERIFSTQLASLLMRKDVV